MIRKIIFITVLAIVITTQAFALDKGTWENLLVDLSQGISQTAYALNERAGTAERETYEGAVAKAEKAEREMAKMVSAIENASDLQEAVTCLQAFSAKGAVEKQAGATILRLLKDRAAFLHVGELALDAEMQASVQEVAKAEIQMVRSGDEVLTRNQKRLILVQVPVAEGAIYLSDGKENRRVEALNALLERHGCRLVASAKDESGDAPQYNYYVSGKKFVLEALIRHFKGTLVNSDLQAVMVITTGGFWGTANVEVAISPKKDAPEKGSLAWYQAVLEKDPFKYLAETQYEKLKQVGKIENVGGEQKLRLKNAKVELWIMAQNGTKRDAIYKNSVDFGDVYVSAR